MAKKIAVYGVSGTPETGDIKKTSAQLLVRRLLACWLVENVSIQRVSIKSVRLPSSPLPILARPSQYIPERLPPVEVPGVYFEPPLGWANWYPALQLELSI